MSYVPPHMRRKAAILVVAPPPPGLRFIGNTTGNTNVMPNNGTRHSPKRSAATPKKRTLKMVRRLTPNAKPPAPPTTAISKMPRLFQKMVKNTLQVFTPKSKKAAKKSKKAKKPTKAKSRKLHKRK